MYLITFGEAGFCLISLCYHQFDILTVIAAVCILHGKCKPTAGGVTVPTVRLSPLQTHPLKHHLLQFMELPLLTELQECLLFLLGSFLRLSPAAVLALTDAKCLLF